MTETEETNDTPDPNDQEYPFVADRRRRTIAAGAILGLSLLLLLIAINTTGFGPYEDAVRAARPPTWWDWLQLLIVPAVLALGALWFNKTQKDTELRIADKARAADRDIAEQARTADREIAEARQRQATLEAYYDRMTELLLDRKMRESPGDSEVRSIARARTVAVIRSLDADRNQLLLTFLRTSELIDPEQPIIELAYADLSQADLSRADLRKADLRGVVLSGTKLSGSVLLNANMSAADLSGANLSGAFLNQANLNGAELSRADLSRADLKMTDLSMAHLCGVNLHEANLSGADLLGAKLLGATGWTIEQLEQAKDVTGATMPDGVRLGRMNVEAIECLPRLEGPTFAEWKTQYLARQAVENRPPSP